MRKQTIVDQIEIQRDGTLQVRFAKQFVDDDNTVLTSEWHRTAFPPGHDIAAQMEAVNNNLVSMNCVAVDASELTRLNDVAAQIWTGDIISAYRQALEDAAEQTT